MLEFQTLSLKYYPKLSLKDIKIINELSYHTTKLYNVANYENANNKVLSYVKMNKLHKSNWHNEYLHSHTYQQCLKVLEKDWKSYFKAYEDYKKNPSKYKGIPKPPNYKNINNRKNQIIFTNYAIRFENTTIKLSLSKKMKSKFNVKSLNFELDNVIQKHIELDNIQQIKITWDKSKKTWALIIVYRKTIPKLDSSFNNIMSIDVGLTNLATITFDSINKSYLISGKTLKSKNSYYNKEIAKLTSIGMKQQSNSKYFKRTKKIAKLQEKRNNYVNNYLHKASRKIINLALENKCSTILIGNIKNIKQNMNYNKTFVQLPIMRLIGQIQYKAEGVGIEIKNINEAFTSGCSSIDLEPLTNEFYNKTRRIKRGIFKTNSGLVINSDINGSLNIMRKINVVSELINQVRDNGFVNNPIRIRIA